MAQRRVTTLAVAILVLLTTGASTAADRLRDPGGPRATIAITPPFTMLPVPAGTFVLPVNPAIRLAPLSTAPGCATPPMLPATPATAGRAVGPVLHVHVSPNGPVARSLPNPTIEGQPLNVLVLERRGAWLRVQLAVRPNHTSGWVRITDVAQRTVPYRILVELCAKRLTVLRDGKAVWQRPVAVGKAATPTPKGSFFVDFVTPMRYGGAYGPYLLSVAGFSNVLHQFGNGGIGQIGIHGTNRPSSIGTAASHGCVRLRNADLLLLVKMIPAGTPVTIAA